MDLINYIVGGLGILGGLVGAVCTMVVPVVILGAVGFYLYKRNQKSTEYRKAAQSWPSTTGLVITSTIQSKRTGRSVSEYPVIIYQYSVHGREYQASTIKTGEQFLKVGGSIVSNATIKRYPVGSTVTVFYNPENPGEAALER